MKAKVLFLALISLFLASSCSKQWCYTTYPLDTVTVVNTVYRDTIITVPVFSVDDTTLAWGTVFDTVYASSGTAHATTYVIRDTLKLTVWQSDTTLKVKLDSAIKVISAKNTEIYTVKQECKKGKIERCLWVVFAIALTFFAGLVVTRFFGKK